MRQNSFSPQHPKNKAQPFFQAIFVKTCFNYLKQGQLISLFCDWIPNACSLQYNICLCLILNQKLYNCKFSLFPETLLLVNINFCCIFGVECMSPLALRSKSGKCDDMLCSLFVTRYLEDGTYLGSPLQMNGFTFLVEWSL